MTTSIIGAWQKSREDSRLRATNVWIFMGSPVATPVEVVERRIYLIRGHKVMFDTDLAELYQVSTGNLNLAVRRNLERFPEDFMFQLTTEEMDILILQTARARWGGRRIVPYVFTEHG